VNVDVAHHVRTAVRREQPIDQRLQPVGLVHDDLGVFGQLGCRQLHRQQLSGTADAAQRVLDLVRQVADQLAVGLDLVQRALFAILARLLLDLDHLHQHQLRTRRGAPVATRVHLCDDHVHREVFRRRRRAAAAAQRGLQAAGGHLVARHRKQGLLQRRGIAEALEQAGAHQRTPRHAHDRFEACVDEQHRPVGAGQRHQRGQQIECLVARIGAHGHATSTGAGHSDLDRLRPPNRRTSRLGARITAPAACRSRA
jgi:hypothetical protein